MFTLLLSALLLAAPAAPAQAFLAPPTDSDALQKLLDQEGCRWGSKTSILCLEVDVDMGFATLALAFYSVTRPTPGTPTQRFTFYRDGNTGFEAKKVDKAAWDAAMALMAKSTFTRGTREKSALPKGFVTLPGVRWTQPKPIWKTAQARKCCRWRIERSTRFARSAAVVLGVDCDFTGDDAKKANACYINDYNEESRDRRQFIMVGPAPKR